MSAPVDLDHEPITEKGDRPTLYDEAWAELVPQLQQRIRGRQPRKWHHDRARAVAKPRTLRAEQCGTQVGWLYCGCKRRPMYDRCRVRDLCESCRSRWSKRAYARSIKALREQGELEWYRWEKEGRRPGMRPALVLLTLTIRDSGDLARDEGILKAAWHDWRAWLRGRLGRSWPYELRVEVTPGTGGLGHVHLHAIGLLPWVSWEDANAAWRRAVSRKGGHSTQWDISATRASVDGMRRAARYLAKYSAKGEDLRHLPTLAASWRVAHYGRRTTTASRGWWVQSFTPPCDSCGAWTDFVLATRFDDDDEAQAWFESIGGIMSTEDYDGT